MTSPDADGPYCTPDDECIDRAVGPWDLCDQHLREFTEWQRTRHVSPATGRQQEPS